MSLIYEWKIIVSMIVNKKFAEYDLPEIKNEVMENIFIVVD